MLFASLDFFVFFIILLFFMAIAPHNNLKKVILLIASYFFYGYWDARFLLLILASTLINFLIGQALFRADKVASRKLLLAVAIVANLSFLGFFKYYNFFIDFANPVLFPLGTRLLVLNIILPVGISFFTFETISYIFDIYRKETTPARNLLDFALFVAFFPRLVAGPIVRARDFLPQLNQDIRLQGHNLWYGGQIFLGGLVKKLLVADMVAPYVDNVFVNPQIFSSATIWLAVIAYAAQIYADFSGYSDMAIGCARILGIHLERNFNVPYVSRDVSEFWRRWHISLSSWLRDYLYIPLGGNRKGEIRTYINLIVTMLLGGLWHGASWNFVIWGGLHGSGLIVHRLWRQKLGQKLILPAALSVLLTFVFVCFCWVPFRLQSVEAIFIVYSKMLFLNPAGDTWLHLTTVIAIILIILDHIAGYERHQPELVFFRTPYRFSAALTITLVIFAIYLFAPTDVAPFIYFQF